MDIVRRAVMRSALYTSAAGIFASKVAFANQKSDCAAQNESDLTHVLRHYVLVTGSVADLDAIVASLEAELGMRAQPKKELTKFGFFTSVVIIGKSILEVAAPFSPGRRPNIDRFLHERGGPGIYKLVFQTFDATALRKRIYAYKLKLDRDEELMGQQMITLESEIFATYLETFQYTPLDKWWAYDSAKDYVQSDIVEEINGCDLVVENPGAVATLVASLFNAELDSDLNIVRFQKNMTLPFDSRTIRFVEPMDERRGVLTIDVQCRDRARVGNVVAIGGADFRFV